MTEERRRILSPSNAYIYNSMGFVYKPGSASIFPIDSLLAPFSGSLWLTLFAILSLSIPIILRTKNLSRKWRHFYIGGRMNRTPILNAWASCLGHSIANAHIANARSISNFARTLIIFWIILWFIVRSFYEGALFNYLQYNQPPSPYDTIEKVLTSNCKVITQPSFYADIARLVKKER